MLTQQTPSPADARPSRRPAQRTPFLRGRPSDLLTTLFVVRKSLTKVQVIFAKLLTTNNVVSNFLPQAESPPTAIVEFPTSESHLPSDK